MVGRGGVRSLIDKECMSLGSWDWGFEVWGFLLGTWEVEGVGNVLVEVVVVLSFSLCFIFVGLTFFKYVE